MTFYEALEICMRRKGMKPVEVSERAGLNESYISRLKHGKMKSVEWEKALRIIEALGMTPNEFRAVQLGDVANPEGEDGEC